MTFRIRAGEPADWLIYREIRLRMLAETPDAYGSSYAFEVDLPESRWRERVTHPLLFLAMDHNHEVVGTATGLVAPNDTVEVVAMYVAPDARGQGCAGQLLDAVATAAWESGAVRLTLRVTAGNGPATRCYTRYGFRPTGRSWPMERNPELTEVELALALD